VIHTLPIAANAREAGAAVGWLTEKAYAPLLDGNRSVDRIFVADTKSLRRHPLSFSLLTELGALRRQLRAFEADATLDVQDLWKSARLARLPGAPVIGFSGRERREPPSALLARDSVTPASRARHVVDRNLTLLSIGLSRSLHKRRPKNSGNPLAGERFSPPSRSPVR
jgi:ADP-heptose:LPS heptosyltransferase